MTPGDVVRSSEGQVAVLTGRDVTHGLGNILAMGGEYGRRLGNPAGDPLLTPSAGDASSLSAGAVQDGAAGFSPIDWKDFRAALFDDVRTATILSDTAGCVLAINDQARRLLAGNLLLRLEKGRLESLSREYSRQLALIIARSTLRTRIHPFPAAGAHSAALAISVRRSSGDPPFVIIRVRKPDAPPLQRLGPVAMAFGLTLREARLLRLLVSGMDVREAAKAMQVSVSTARTFIKHIYLKLGVSSRLEIIALVLGFWAFDD